MWLARRWLVGANGDWFDDWLDHELQIERRGVTGHMEPCVLAGKGAEP